VTSFKLPVGSLPRELGEMPLGCNPPEFGGPVYDYTQNPLTKAGFELGRAFFYDPIPSVDSTISCASCRQQAVDFAHADHDLSHGFEGRRGTRNSPTLFNNRWYPAFFWDGGGNHIELVLLNAITSEVEMNQPFP
jgi:cytochrome c peroxidase